MGGTDPDGGSAGFSGTEWCLTICVKGGGLLKVKANGCPCAGNRAAARGSEGWKTGTFGDRVYTPCPSRSEVLEFVGLFSTPVLDIQLAFPGCLLIGALCGFLGAVSICGILFDDSFGGFGMDLELGLRGLP